MTGHPLFARMFAGVVPWLDRAGLAERRRRVVDGLAGDVVEVGAGTGASLDHYPPTVSDLLAVEPEPYLLRQLRARTLASTRDRQATWVRAVAGSAERLPLADASRDAVVTMLTLCSVSDVDAAAAEAFRVLRPGGELRAFEHVVADGRALRSVQRAVDATFWPRLFGGCHTTRDPLPALLAAGFVVERADRRRFPDWPVSFPTTPHRIIVARKPGPTAGAR